jgi:hypothetical protein
LGTHINTRENHGNAFFYAIAIAGKMLLRTFEELLNVDNAFQPRSWKFLGDESREVGTGFQNMNNDSEFGCINRGPKQYREN